LVLISPALSDDVVSVFGIDVTTRLRLPLSDRQKVYMRYHREHVFKAPAEPTPGVSTVQVVSAPAPIPEVPTLTTPSVDSDPWNDLLAQFPEGDEFRPFVEEALPAGYAGLPAPEAWIDLPDGRGGTATTAVFAWPSEKVAFVRDEDVADCASLLRHGWTIASPNDTAPLVAFLAL